MAARLTNSIDLTDCGIRVYTDHPLYHDLRLGFPSWAFLHERPGGVVVLMAEVPGSAPAGRGPHLWFHNPRQQEALLREQPAASLAFWDDLLDTLLGCARSHKEVHGRKAREARLTDDVTVTLSRMGVDAFDPEHYAAAELALTTPLLDVTVPDVSPRDLKALGAFLIDYATTMETETREHPREHDSAGRHPAG
jgi:hypothetical protein